MPEYLSKNAKMKLSSILNLRVREEGKHRGNREKRMVSSYAHISSNRTRCARFRAIDLCAK